MIRGSQRLRKELPVSLHQISVHGYFEMRIYAQFEQSIT